MASELSNYLANAVLGWVKGTQMPAPPATVYVALFSADPTAAGTLTNEVTTTVRAAGRVAVVWSAIAGRAMTNSEAIDFGTAAGGASVTHAAIMDAQTAGNMLSWTPLDEAKSILAGDPVVIPVNDMRANFN